MSGRDHEPISAFFPAIDRNLMRDLDRQLRAAPLGSATQATEPPPPPPPAPVPRLPAAAFDGGSRPNVSTIVEAVEHAAQSIATMTARIQDLESHIYELQTANGQLESQLTEAGDRIDELEVRLRSESDRGNEAERLAAEQMERASMLERDLALAHADLTKVAETISASLGIGYHGQDPQAP